MLHLQRRLVALAAAGGWTIRGRPCGAGLCRVDKRGARTAVQVDGVIAPRTLHNQQTRMRGWEGTDKGRGGGR